MNSSSQEHAISERRVEAHFDSLTDDIERYQARNAYFHAEIARLVTRMIPPEAKSATARWRYLGNDPTTKA